MSCVELFPEIFYFDELTNKIMVVEGYEDIGELSPFKGKSICPRECVKIE